MQRESLRSGQLDSCPAASAAARQTVGRRRSTAEKYSSQSVCERALWTLLDRLTSAKTFSDLPAASSQRAGRERNENTVLRQYFPKGTSIFGFTQEQLDESPPSSTAGLDRLGWMTPTEKLDEVLH